MRAGVVRVNGRGDVVDQIVSVTRRLTHRVRDALETSIREVSRSLLRYYRERRCLCGRSDPDRIRNVSGVAVSGRCDGHQIAVRIIGVAIDLAGRIRDLLDATLRVAHERQPSDCPRCW